MNALSDYLTKSGREESGGLLGAYVSTVFTMEGATALSDNHLLIDGGNLTTAAKCLYGAFGAVDSTGLVTNNEVIIKGDSNTANCLGYGGYSRYGGANENKVSITDGSVTAIWGGMGWASSANGNHVTVDHANVTGDNGDAIYGGDAGNSADNNQVLVKGGTISSLNYSTGKGSTLSSPCHN